MDLKIRKFEMSNFKDVLTFYSLKFLFYFSSRLGRDYRAVIKQSSELRD